MVVDGSVYVKGDNHNPVEVATVDGNVASATNATNATNIAIAGDAEGNYRISLSGTTLTLTKNPS